MKIEIERKFLVTGALPSGIKGADILQGYLLAKEERTVRIRTVTHNNAAQGYLTIKSKSSSSGISRFEFETELPIKDAEKLLVLCDQPLINKTRFKIEYAGFIWEIDEFHDKNAGLVIAEIELQSEDQSFSKPDFIGPEVTGDIRYYNSMLQSNPYSEWPQ